MSSNDSQEGAGLQRTTERDLTLDAYGFDARNHAAAEGIQAKAWHPNLKQRVAIDTISIAVSAVTKVLNDVAE